MGIGECLANYNIYSHKHAHAELSYRCWEADSCHVSISVTCSFIAIGFEVRSYSLVRKIARTLAATATATSAEQQQAINSNAAF